MWPKQSEKTKRNHLPEEKGSLAWAREAQRPLRRAAYMTVMSPIEAKFCIIMAITDVGRNCEGGQRHKNKANGGGRVTAPLTSPA